MKHILVIAGMSLALAGCVHKLNEQERLVAEAGARDTADRSQADFVGCSGQDSDGDSYVTCTIKPRVVNAPEIELLCAYESRGCKRKI